MEFTYDSSGTARQKAWVDEAIGRCGYDLSLIPAAVTVTWVDRPPTSELLGHAHSYMSTDGLAPAGPYTIYVANWADDWTNPNNSGLPDPQNDIQTFYEQSFVHELGHVVHFSTITTDAERSLAAGEFWTPDPNGGAGKQFGTLADWSSSIWQHNMMEAIAETFKIVYYDGQLIYRNRTIWQIDADGWNPLWALLIPQLKGLQTNSNSGSSGANSSWTVDTQFGLSYLDQMIYVMEIGPAGPPPGARPPAPTDPGGTYTGGGIAVVAHNPHTGEEIALATLTVTAIAQTNGLGTFRDYYNEWNATIGPGGAGGGFAHIPYSNDHEVMTIEIAPIEGAPGHLQIACNGPAGTLRGEWDIGTLDDLLLGSYTDSFAGVIDMPVKTTWGLKSSIGPPPYPFGPFSGSMGVGAGLRGAILIGSN